MLFGTNPLWRISGRYRRFSRRSEYGVTPILCILSSHLSLHRSVGGIIESGMTTSRTSLPPSRRLQPTDSCMPTHGWVCRYCYFPSANSLYCNGEVRCYNHARLQQTISNSSSIPLLQLVVNERAWFLWSLGGLSVLFWGYLCEGNLFTFLYLLTMKSRKLELVFCLRKLYVCRASSARLESPSSSGDSRLWADGMACSGRPADYRLVPLKQDNL